MGFFRELFEIAKEIYLDIQLSQVYPTLRDAIEKYRNEGYIVSNYDLFSANLYKDGFWGRKSIYLQVLEDGSVQVNDKNNSYKIRPTFGTPKPSEFLEEFKRKREERNSKNSKSEDTNTPHIKMNITLDEAYLILEIPKTASMAEVKKAYHEKASAYHPDRVASMPQEFRDLAHQKFIQIQKAYEMIVESRK